MATVLFVGGGSGGHIAPSAAVAHALKKIVPDADIHFITGMKKEEAVFLRKEGFVSHALNAPRLSAAFPWKFWSAVRSSRALLRKLKPDVIFSKGGFVSVPLCFAARRMHIPVILHESDVVSGYANRLVAHWADHICFSFAHQKIPRGKKSTLTGNPVRPNLNAGSADEGFRIAGLEGRNKPVLLILGGSLGAAALNDFVKGCLSDLLALFDIIHLTGHGKGVVHNPIRGYWSAEFVYEELPHLYAAADIALSRAGMNVLCELAANEIPTILVPLRGVAHDHQEANARAVENLGACVVVEQQGIAQKLFPRLRYLSENPNLRRKLSKNIATLYKPDASGRIAKIILEYLA